MAVCNPAANAPLPAGIRLLTPCELTPRMKQWADGYAYDLRVPYYDPRTGAGLYRAWFDAATLPGCPPPPDPRVPIVALVQCHGETIINGEHIAGAYHGVTLFRAIDPAFFPPSVATTTTTAASSGTDWPVVAVAGVAIATVVASFFGVLRVAGAERARA